MASTRLRSPLPRHPSQPPSDPPERRGPLAARCALLSFLWPGLGENFSTDIPAKHPPALARLATSINMSRVVSIGFVPPEFTSGVTATGASMPDIPAIRQAVRDALRKPPAPTDPRTIGGGACV
jgi:hypothetical protein